MGLLDFLAPALTGATQAAGAYQGAEANAAQMQRETMIQSLMMMRQQQAFQTDQALKAAQTNSANATGNLRNRDAGTPRPQDGQSYLDSVSNTAGAKIAGETQPLVAQTNALAAPRANAAGLAAGASARATQPITQQNERYASGLTEGREENLIPLRAQATVAAQTSSARAGMMGARQFQTMNKPLLDSVQPYSQAKNAFAEARAGNPAALKSALLAYASVADPKAQLRQGVMNYVTQVDPSFKGTFEMALDRMTKGQLPPRIISDMEQMVDRLHQTNASLYDQRRKAYVGKVPISDAYIPDTETMFNVPGVSSPASGGAASPAGGNTVQVNGKTFQLPQ